MIQVTQKTIDWLTMTDSGLFIGLAQRKRSKIITFLYLVLAYLARVLLLLSVLIVPKGYFFSRDQGDTWIESERFLGLPKDVRKGVWIGIAQWKN